MFSVMIANLVGGFHSLITKTETAGKKQSNGRHKIKEGKKACLIDRI